MTNPAARGAMAAIRTPDALMLILLTAVAAALRAFDLGSPARLVFDESYYAQDACTYLALGRDVCGGISEASWMHPPLGKWIIAAGIAIGGYDATAWRAPSAVAGTLIVPAVYLLSRRLGLSVLAAGVAGAIVALDPLSIISSRVAMLDIFVVLAGVLGVTFAVIHRDQLRDAASPRGLLSLPLAAAGACGGVATATKWSGVLVLLTIGVMVVIWELEAMRQRGRRQGDIRAMLVRLAVWLVVLPMAVYVLSYVGRLQGQLFALPWQQDALPRVFGGRQLRMAQFHIGLDGTHPYESPAWSWLIGKRAVPYYFQLEPDGSYREILAFANLPVWLPMVLAVAYVGFRLVRLRDPWSAELVAFTAFAGAYLPWLILASGRQFVFLHYILPAIPFLALSTGLAVDRGLRRLRTAGAMLLVATALGSLIFFAPLIYAWPMDYGAWRQRILFTDCGSKATIEGQLRPSPEGGLPPVGWCWV
jgi:dolichyl-phosphate-mannose--protein O-mannosyl transferase